MDTDSLLEFLETNLVAALGENAFDLTMDDDNGSIELATDDWTLVLESWPHGIGFLAVDDEPTAASEAELDAAIEAVIGAALRTLREAESESEGAIVTALTRTTDPMSNGLARLLRAGS